MTRAHRCDDGSALALGWVGLATTAVVLVVVVDLAAYLGAAARAQAAADAAALAAVAVSDRRAGLNGDPRAAAARVAVESGGELRRCDCASGREEVDVAVAVAVRAIAVTRFAGRTVTAQARARLIASDADPDR